MRASHRPLVRHAPALLAAAAVLAAALGASELAPSPAALRAAQVSIGPAPDADSGMPDACSRRVGCLKR